MGDDNTNQIDNHTPGGVDTIADTAAGEYDTYGSASTGTIFDHLPGEQQIRPAKPLLRFSAEHWLYLARMFPEQVPEAPVELAPFPAPLHSDAQLQEQLSGWGYTSGAGGPSEQLVDLMRGIALPRIKFWGQVRFPQSTFTTQLDLPPEAAEWGINPTQTIVPRVPFLVSWNPEVVYLATSGEEGLTIVAAEPSTTDPSNTAAVGTDLATAWQAIVDPAGEWPTTSIPKTRIPEKLADNLAASQTLGEHDSTSQGVSQAQREARKILAASELGTAADFSDEVGRIAELLCRETVATAQGVVSVIAKRTGDVETSDKAVSIVLIRNAESDPESFLVSPEWRGRDVFSVFNKNTPTLLSEAVSRIIRVTSR